MTQDPKLTKISNFLSLINKRAYQDLYLLSNQVLSKNPFTNNFIFKFYKNEPAVTPAKANVAFKIMKYYFKSLKSFLSYCVEMIIFRTSAFTFKYSGEQKELTVIDTFFILSKIKKEGLYRDTYFNGLDSILEKKKQTYAYLPVFDGKRKCYKFMEILKILKKSGRPILCEYQLLNKTDILRLLQFILSYPWHVLNFAKTLASDNYEEKLLKTELLATIDDVTYRSFSRYLQGARIANLPYDKIKIISWYENQVIDKNLYKGLRSHGLPEKISIYGAQLLLYSKNILNIVPDETEKPMETVPDKILVNGPELIPKNTGLNYRVGPSLRYSKIFSRSTLTKKRENILMLLPYFPDEIENMLNFLKTSDLNTRQILIKSHPAVEINRIKNMLTPNLVLTSEDIYKLFETTKILLGSSSGTLLEAACLSIPIIYIKNPSRFDCNPLPKYGKGIIWQDVNTPEELFNQLDKFETALAKNQNEIATIASRYKEMFFCEPTEENIVKSFDL